MRAVGRVLIAQGQPDPALAHFRKGISLNPKDDVAYYLLSQADKALDNVAGEQQALTKFQRPQSQKSRQKERLSGEPSSSREVTKQELNETRKIQ